MNVEIIVDGKSLELNDFVKTVTFQVASGIINSLRDVPDWANVEIKLKK
jgi:hypothetical protein